MVYMGGRGKNNASRSNQTSHYGIMGGLAPSTNINSGVRRFRLRRARNKQTIPLGAGPGLEFMRKNGLLSKNPAGSGGVGLTAVLVERSIGTHGDGDDGFNINTDPGSADDTCGSAGACGDYKDNNCWDGSGEPPEWVKTLSEQTAEGPSIGLEEAQTAQGLNGKNVCTSAPCGQRQMSQAGENPFTPDTCNILANLNLGSAGANIVTLDDPFVLAKSFVTQYYSGNFTRETFEKILDAAHEEHPAVITDNVLANMKDYINCPGIDGMLWNVCACQWQPTGKKCASPPQIGSCNNPNLDYEVRACNPSPASDA